MIKLKRDEILANDIQKATSGERILVIDDFGIDPRFCG